MIASKVVAIKMVEMMQMAALSKALGMEVARLVSLVTAVTEKRETALPREEMISGMTLFTTASSRGSKRLTSSSAEAYSSLSPGSMV